MRILIADDHAIMREGLRHILVETPEIEIAGEAANGREVIEIVDRGDVDLVLLDISMPGMNGLEVLRILKKHHPRLPVLILSMYPEEQYAIRSLRAGAAGYLTKEGASEELIAAVRKVASGGKYIGLSLAEKIAFDLEDDSRVLPHEKLSDREYEVFRGIVAGRTSGEIANELSLSVKTISTYRQRVMTKMRMRTNSELTRYAVLNGLID